MIDDTSSDDIELIRRRKDDLESEAMSMGLYLDDWNPLVAREEVGQGEAITHGRLLQAVFTVGDLAFSDRVQNSEKLKVDEEFEAIVNADIYDRAIDAREMLSRLVGDEEDDD